MSFNNKKMNKEQKHKKKFLEEMHGIYVIGKRELFANLKSGRIVILIIIFGLVMLGGSFGITKMPTKITEEDFLIVNAFPIDLDNGPLKDDVKIFIFDKSKNKIDCDVYIDKALYGKSIKGIFEYKNFSKGEHDVFVENNTIGKGATNFRIDITKNETIIAKYFILSIEKNNKYDDVFIQVVNDMGEPLNNVKIKIEEEKLTDENGVAIFYNLTINKDFTAKISYEDNETELLIITYRNEDVFSLLRGGSDDVFLFIANFFIALFIPIFAIALSFDCIAKEKFQNSIDFLVSKPLSKMAISFGKSLGIISAISLPVIVISILSIIIITNASGKSPSFNISFGFLIFTVLLIAIFVLVQQIFSTLARTTGTAILSGIGIWLLFFMLWTLIVVGIAVILGVSLPTQTTTPKEYNDLSEKVGLANPVGVYQMSMEALRGYEFSFPSYFIFISFALWIVIPLILSMEIFSRKIG